MSGIYKYFKDTDIANNVYPENKGRKTGLRSQLRRNSDSSTEASKVDKDDKMMMNQDKMMGQDKKKTKDSYEDYMKK